MKGSGNRQNKLNQIGRQGGKGGGYGGKPPKDRSRPWTEPKRGKEKKGL